MNAFPFLVDTAVPCLRHHGAAASVALAPLGTRTLLQQIASRVGRHMQEGLTVLTTFAPDSEYEAAVRQASANIERIAPASQWSALLGNFEPSDWILLIDPCTWPVGGLNLSNLLRGAPDPRTAKHLVALDTSEQGTKEYAQLDCDGQVCRIRRYYDGVTWLQAGAVPCSLVSASCLRLLERPSLASLLEVRGALASCGVPSQDILLESTVLDLRQPENLLRLAEQSLAGLAERWVPGGYRRLGANVLVAASCQVDPTAKLHGPIIMQDGATIDAGAIVIGPTLIGANSHVEAGATVAQCLLMPKARIAVGTTAYHRVVCRQDASRQDPQAEAAATGMHPLPAGRLAVPASLLAQRQRWYRRAKRVLDVTFAAVGLVVLGPLLGIIAALIRLDSDGPVFFGHEREGWGGRVFRCWKFRTMIHGAHARQRQLYAKSAVDGPQFKIEKDPRITRIGRLLRATNLDELPQLVNVLLGQMSLIGPRPSPFRENQICIPWRRARLSVRPGITGLWQICRNRRGSGDFHQWIYYDMLYVRHASLWLDIKILVATLVTMGGRWGVPVWWIIPQHKLYTEGRPWMIPAFEEIEPQATDAETEQPAPPSP